MYVKVVFGLPVEGPFDYSVPEVFLGKAKPGARVRVSFGAKNLIGYVVGLCDKTSVKKTKPVLDLIDKYPVLNKNMLLLTKELSEYYCCSHGEAIETALPQGLREGRDLPGNAGHLKATVNKGMAQVILIHDLDDKSRWDIYLKEIKEAVDNGRQVIFLLPDIESVLKAKAAIVNALGIVPVALYRKETKELEEWAKVKSGAAEIVIGTRSAVFAPLENPGLVIIESEEQPVYKQDQVPHYHAREAAFMRVKLDKAKLILGSRLPTLESFYLAKKNKIQYILLPRRKNFPETKIFNAGFRRRGAKQESVLSKYLLDSIASSLDAKEKVLLFLNRKGFATFASCPHCAAILKCPRCNISLVYHSKANLLSCHYCNFRMAPPNICPQCNSGYIRYSGTGMERIESELSRIFAKARIKSLDGQKEPDFNNADIFVSTQSILAGADYDFGLIGVISIDNSLNRLDFRASEKTFGLLAGLIGLTSKRIIIQTALAGHYVFKALENKDVNIFYDEELRQRKQLSFPPYRHIGLVKLRGNDEPRVREISSALYEGLKKCNMDAAIEIVSVNPGQPPKLRGNYYWQVLLKAKTPKRLSRFLKTYLKKFPHSGIIVTVDIDPL